MLCRYYYTYPSDQNFLKAHMMSHVRKYLLNPLESQTVLL